MKRITTALLVVALATFIAMANIAMLRYKVTGLEARISAYEIQLAKNQRELNSLRARINQRYEAIASWYGPGFHGRRAADGSRYDQMGMTAAHKTLPLGTIVVFEANGKRVPAVITDRGPFIPGRDFDLSLGVARKLGIEKQGVATVRIYEIRF